MHNVLVRAAVMTDDAVLGQAELEAAAGGAAGPPGGPFDLPLGDGFDIEAHLDDVRRHYLRRAMREAGGNKTRASKLLGMRHYQTLAAQLDRLGVAAGPADE